MARIEVAPVQEAVVEWLTVDGHTWSNLCNRLGWMETNTKPESSRLQRCLGLRKVSTGGNSHSKQYKYTNKKISESTALRIIEAIGKDPTQYGLSR